MNKWDRILLFETATKTRKEVFDDHTLSGTDIISKVPGLPGTIFDTINGYKVGSTMGHPVVGAVFGREGALGASSNYDNKTNSESHSQFYDLKKNTNYKEFYKNINKYDNQVKVLIHVYNEITYNQITS